MRRVATSPGKPQAFATGEDQADANVDYSNASGYFVRLDVELEFFDDHFCGPGHLGWLVLSSEDAERLGAQLVDRALTVRKSNAERSSR